MTRRGKHRKKGLAAETPAAPDLVKRRFVANRPNEFWVADITYIPTWEGWLFLGAVMDVFTKRIVGWSMRDDLKTDIVIDALGMATTVRRPDTSGPRDHASMGSRGDAFDNVAAESLMSTIKAELVHRNRFKTKDEARFAVFRYIEGFYNPLRRHSSIGYMSPAEYEKILEDAPAAALMH